MNNQRSVKSLTKKAENGSLMAAYTLFEYYSNGSYVEKDADKAEHYSDLIRAQASSLKLRILSISLDSFRGFKKLKVNLHNGKFSDDSVAFTGVNGVGKSSILDAIVYGLGWFTQRMINPKHTHTTLNEQDIYQAKSEKSDFVSIVLQLQINASDIFTVELARSREESNLNLKGNYDEINALVGIYRLINDRSPEAGLPLITYYGVERAIEVTSKDIDQNDEVRSLFRQKKLDGYKKAVSGSANFGSFFRWLKDAQDIQNNRIARSSESGVLKLNLIKKFLEKNDLELTGSNFEAVLERIENDEKKSGSPEKSNTSKVTIDRYLKVVLGAAEAFLPGFSNFRIQYEPALDLLLDKNGVTLSVLQLSQGEKSLLALVADIARRLVLLNPSADNPLAGDGVVIIDELDLHLHPEWQQYIYMSLSSVFPNIQFVFSTHSPQVLSTLHRCSVRKVSVDENGAGSAEVPLVSTYASPSNNILHEVMFVDPEPPVPEKPLLDELTSLIENGDYQSHRVDQLFSTLKETIDQSNPQLQRLMRSLRRLSLQKK